MKFLVPNYSWLQNPWLGGYRPQIPVLSLLCPQLNLLNPPTKKNSWVRHWCILKQTWIKSHLSFLSAIGVDSFIMKASSASSSSVALSCWSWGLLTSSDAVWSWISRSQICDSMSLCFCIWKERKKKEEITHINHINTYTVIYWGVTLWPLWMDVWERIT